MKKSSILTVFVLLLCAVFSQAQTTKFSVGVFADIMMEAPSYDAFYGVSGKYDINNHAGVQVYGGLSNLSKTLGADFIYEIFDRNKRNFNIYGGLGVSGDFYKRKIIYTFSDTQEVVYNKANYLAINPTIGVSYRINPVRSTVFAGYKAKYYPMQDFVDINYLSLGIRYHL